MKIIYFSKTVAAYDLKGGRCIELNDLMKLFEYQKSRSLFDRGQKSLCFQPLILFFSKTVELFETRYHVKAFWSRRTKNSARSHGQDGHHAHIL